MKKLIDFVKGWRMEGEPWSLYILVPVVVFILLVAVIPCTVVHFMARAAGFKEGIFE